MPARKFSRKRANPYSGSALVLCISLLCSLAIQVLAPASLHSGAAQSEPTGRPSAGGTPQSRTQARLAAPEREIAGPADPVQAALIREMLRSKYRLDSESASQIVFSRELTREELAPWLLLGQRPKETPRRIVRFSLAERDGKTAVRANVQISGLPSDVTRAEADGRLEVQKFASEMQKVFDSVSASLAEAKAKAAAQESKTEPFIPPISGGD